MPRQPMTVEQRTHKNAGSKIRYAATQKHRLAYAREYAATHRVEIAARGRARYAVLHPASASRAARLRSHTVRITFSSDEIQTSKAAAYARNRPMILAKAKAAYAKEPVKFLARVRSLQDDDYRAARKALFYSGPCYDCGATQSQDGKSLERDHRIPADKLGNVSSNITRALPWLRAEAAKCDLVCRECHVKRTVARRQAALQQAAA